MSKLAGFTMLELIVAISIAAIVGSFALVNLGGISTDFNQTDSQTQFRKHLRLAQLQSVNEGGRGVLVLVNNGTGYEFGYDYITNGYDTVAPATYDSGYREWVETFPADIKAVMSASIIFDSRGRVVDPSGELSSVSVALYDTSSGSDVQFAIGCLSTIGVLSFDGSC